MNIFSSVGTKMVSVEAKVIRADGTVEDLGAIAFWHANPLRRLQWKLGRWLRGLPVGRINKGAPNGNP